MDKQEELNNMRKERERMEGVLNMSKRSLSRGKSPAADDRMAKTTGFA